jgi:hypothetical protein
MDELAALTYQRLIREKKLASMSALSHGRKIFVCFHLENSEDCFAFPNKRATSSLPPRAEVATA